MLKLVSFLLEFLRKRYKLYKKDTSYIKKIDKEKPLGVGRQAE